MKMEHIMIRCLDCGKEVPVTEMHECFVYDTCLSCWEALHPGHQQLIRAEYNLIQEADHQAHEGRADDCLCDDCGKAISIEWYENIGKCEACYSIN